MAAAHEQFAKEVQAVIGTFRRKNNEFQFERYVKSKITGNTPRQNQKLKPVKQWKTTVIFLISYVENGSLNLVF